MFNQLKNYNFIAKKAPINKTAALVVSKGINYLIETKVGRFYSFLPLPTKIFTGNKKDNLSGYSFGRFKIIGWLGKIHPFKKNDKGEGRWLVKCNCGTYEMRKTPAIKRAIKEVDNDDCCQFCQTIRSKNKKFNGKKKYERLIPFFNEVKTTSREDHDLLKII